MSEGSKRPRHSANDEGNKDIISKMPDCLLLHILSFLEAREAVQTSLLSGRWRRLWTEATTMDFDYKSCTDGNPERFVTFVNKYLELHEGPIQKFTVRFNPRFVQHKYVSSWIRILKSRSIMELEIDGSVCDISFGCTKGPGRYLMCKSFFDCKLLRVLKLRQCKMVPATLKPFKDLRKVELESVKYSDIDMTNSHFLESLIVKNCNRHGSLVIKVPTSRFRHLEITDCDISEKTELTLSAPYASLLKIHGKLRGKYSIDKFHHLKEACLGTIYFMDIARVYRLPVLFGLLEIFEDCRTIVLSSSIIVALASATTKHKLEGPFLKAVTAEIECGPSQLDHWILMHALNNFPYLETLIIDICSKVWKRTELFLREGTCIINFTWEELERLSVSAAGSIRNVIMRNFLRNKFEKKLFSCSNEQSLSFLVDSAEYPELATDEDLMPVKVWLASCSSLESMKISIAKSRFYSRQLDSDFLIYLKEKVDLLPKASPNAHISVK